MKKSMLERFAPSPELQAAAQQVSSALETSKECAAVLKAKRLEVERLTGLLRVAEEASGEASASYALGVLNPDAAALKKQMEKCREVVDEQKRELDHTKLVIDALIARGRKSDDAVAAAKSLLQTECDICASVLAGEVQKDVLAAAKQLVLALQTAYAFNSVLRSSAISQRLPDVRVPQLDDAMGFLIDGDRENINGNYQAIHLLDGNDDAQAIQDQLQFITKARAAVSAHRPFDEAVAPPYVRRGFTIKDGGDQESTHDAQPYIPGMADVLR